MKHLVANAIKVDEMPLLLPLDVLALGGLLGGSVGLDSLGSEVASTFLSSLGLGIVGNTVKVDEEQEIAGEKSAAKESSTLGTGALADVRSPGEVGVGKVGVGAEVDESEVKNELDDLECGEVLLPPDANTGSGAHVVVVHEDMDCQVQGDRDPGNRGVSSKLDKAENHGHRVVEVVQELYDGCNMMRGKNVSFNCS